MQDRGMWRVKVLGLGQTQAIQAHRRRMGQPQINPSKLKGWVQSEPSLECHLSLWAFKRSRREYPHKIKRYILIFETLTRL